MSKKGRIAGIIGMIMIQGVLALPSGATVPYPYSAAYVPELTEALAAQEGPFTEIYSTFTVPQVTPSNSSLADWIGIGGAQELIQAGAIVPPISVGPSYCDWENPPNNEYAQFVSGVACDPGDTIYVDIAVDFDGVNESQITFVDETTNQTVHVEAYTPDHVNDLIAYVETEAVPNTNGPAPSSFSPITFSNTEIYTGGFVYSGGYARSLWAFAFYGLDYPFNDLDAVTPGTTVSTVTSTNEGTVSS